MSDDKLLRMANQIAAFFRSYPTEEAIAGVHEHIVAFWSPVMRRDLEARVARGAAGFDPIVIAALQRDGAAPSPAKREAEGPAQAGEIGAMDAG